MVYYTPQGLRTIRIGEAKNTQKYLFTGLSIFSDNIPQQQLCAVCPWGRGSGQVNTFNSKHDCHGDWSTANVTGKNICPGQVILTLQVEPKHFYCIWPCDLSATGPPLSLLHGITPPYIKRSSDFVAFDVDDRQRIFTRRPLGINYRWLML